MAWPHLEYEVTGYWHRLQWCDILLQRGHCTNSGLFKYELKQVRERRYSHSQCRFGKLMFRFTSIFPPLSLSGSSTYSSLTLEERRHEWVHAYSYLPRERAKKQTPNNQPCMWSEKKKKDRKERFWSTEQKTARHATGHKSPTCDWPHQVQKLFLCFQSSALHFWVPGSPFSSLLLAPSSLSISFQSTNCNQKQRLKLRRGFKSGNRWDETSWTAGSNTMQQPPKEQWCASTVGATKQI